MSAKTRNVWSKKYGSWNQLEFTAHQRQLGGKREDVSFLSLNFFQVRGENLGESDLAYCEQYLFKLNLT